MTQTTNQTLVLVEVDGKQTEVENGYAGIKGALKDRPFDFVYGAPNFGAYIDDEGLFIEAALNVPVSMLLGRSIYGPAVCCNGDTDDEGDTLPMNDDVREMLTHYCRRWQVVVASAALIGQDPYTYANEATVPPPEIIPMPEGMSIEEALRQHGYVITLDEVD